MMVAQCKLAIVQKPQTEEVNYLKTCPLKTNI